MKPRSVMKPSGLMKSRSAMQSGNPGSRAVVRTHAAAALAIIAAVAAMLFRFPPDRYPIYPRCPIYTYLHLQCPGCGTTRALAALLRGHLLEALHLNPLSTLLLPIAVSYAAHHVWQQRSRETPGWPHLPNYATYTLLTITAIFTITRNLTTSHLAPCKQTAPASARAVPLHATLSVTDTTYASTFTGSAAAGFAAPFASEPGLRISIPPLKNAPSSIEIRAAITSPVSEPSLRISTRSLA